MAQKFIFQTIAAMGLLAFTIYSVVRYSGRALKNSKNVRIRTYGPIGLGLAAVPALPYLLISQWKRPLNGFSTRALRLWVERNTSETLHQSVESKPWSKSTKKQTETRSCRYRNEYESGVQNIWESMALKGESRLSLMPQHCS